MIDRAIAVDLFFYITIAVAGFFSQFDKTSTIVLERNNGPIGADKKDIPILIAIIGVICSILVAFPVAFNPFRQQFTLIVLKKEKFTDKENLVLSTVFVAVTWVISIYFPKIDKVISIMGGLCAATLDFAIPTFCFVKLSKYSWTAPSNLIRIIFFGILTSIGYCSVAITVYLIITGDAQMPRYKQI